MRSAPGSAASGAIEDGFANVSGVQAQTVIFDCDGVLVDSEGLASRVEAELIRELGLELSVEQVVATAGDGSLKDGSTCCEEMRAFFSQVPSDKLAVYAEQCLASSFSKSGLVLQDIVNEVGARLGASVTHGRYRGSAKHSGFDGLWAFPSGHSIVVEVKTTDAYRIDLNTIADYCRTLISSGRTAEARSSILLVVGRQDTPLCQHERDSDPLGV